ncbi:hypothetical protein HII31_01328 [Pseudocercospora fuligena]|uniref:Uncharacterized protein n=1 Tax=Pseudocercospora fuligena TaxID=685502 RepID=A0A8H6VM71_9PEZI|nr:hypothetical protein HII31_01328 [Pseudocercospora fuligena]
MTLPEHALAYENCTLDELRKFVQDRGLHNAEDIPPSQQECIQLLRNADEASTFRFMALAGELRNRIYDKLLTLNEKSRCHPLILAASKSINNEASQIIYATNIPTIRFEANHILFLETERARHDRRFEPTMKLNAPTWPVSFLKFEKVRILLEDEALNDAIDEGYCRAAWESGIRWGGELYNVVAFLQKSHTLMKVVIEGKPYGNEDRPGRLRNPGSYMRYHSFPLSRLCANIDVEFSNMDLWPNFEAKVREDARVHEDLLRHNILLGMQCVQTERLYCHSLLGTLGKIAPLEVVEEFHRISSQMNWRYDVICWFNADMEQHMKDIIVKSSPILDEIFSLAGSHLDHNHSDPKTEEYIEAHAIRLSLNIR